MKIFFLISMFMLVVLPGCAGKASRASVDVPPPPNSAASGGEVEKRLLLRADEEMRTLDNSGFLYEDKGLEAYLNDVARKLLPPETYKGVPIKVKVLRNPALNAFALPNGVVYVNTGIVARMENEAQLATLLAHEITHITHRHAVKEFAEMMRTSDDKSTLVGLLSGLGEFLGHLSTLASVRGYSRELETEADVDGLKLVVKAGYDPQEAPKLFEYLKQELEEDKIEDSFFFSSHPKIVERIENYNGLLRTAYAGRDGETNARAFRKHATSLLLDTAELDVKRASYRSAERSIEKYLEHKSNDPRAFYLLGEIYRHRVSDDTEKAKANYEKTLSLQSNQPEAYRALGLLQYKTGDRPSARINLQKYLTLKPEASDREYIREYLRESGGKP